MKKILAFIIYPIYLIAFTGCFAIDEERMPIQSCSKDWYLFIEKEISTGDNQGHGPDLGSMEWRSVIEFRLGIRGSEDVPALDSEQWCDYINNHVVDKSA